MNIAPPSRTIFIVSVLLLLATVVVADVKYTVYFDGKCENKFGPTHRIRGCTKNNDGTYSATDCDGYWKIFNNSKCEGEPSSLVPLQVGSCSTEPGSQNGIIVFQCDASPLTEVENIRSEEHTSELQSRPHISLRHRWWLRCGNEAVFPHVMRCSKRML